MPSRRAKSTHPLWRTLGVHSARTIYKTTTSPIVNGGASDLAGDAASEGKHRAAGKDQHPHDDHLKVARGG